MIKAIKRLTEQRKEFEAQCFESGQRMARLWALKDAKYQDLVALDDAYNNESKTVDILLAEIDTGGHILDIVLGHANRSSDGIILNSKDKDSFDFAMGFLTGVFDFKQQIDCYSEERVTRAIELTEQECKAVIIEAREGECILHVGGEEIKDWTRHSAMEQAVEYQLKWLKKKPDFKKLNSIEIETIQNQLSGSLENEWDCI